MCDRNEAETQYARENMIGELQRKGVKDAATRIEVHVYAHCTAYSTGLQC